MALTYYFKNLKSQNSLQLKDIPALVGRSEHCDVQIAHESLSREHSRLTLNEHRLLLEDLHSTNGTYVNGRKVAVPTFLEVGDVVRFGQETYCLQSSDGVSTQKFDRNTKYDLNSAIFTANEEDEDGTSKLQEIALPFSWRKFEKSHHMMASSKDKKLIIELKKLSLKKLRHSNGLMIVVTTEDKVPSVKVLTTSKTVTSWTIGRSCESAIRLDDSRVSESHCEFSFKDGLWSVKDKNSLNGTFLLNKKITSMDIQSILELSVGPYTLTVEPILKK